MQFWKEGITSKLMQFWKEGITSKLMQFWKEGITTELLSSFSESKDWMMLLLMPNEADWVAAGAADGRWGRQPNPNPNINPNPNNLSWAELLGSTDYKPNPKISYNRTYKVNYMLNLGRNWSLKVQKKKVA